MAASISPPQDSLGMMQEEESLINTVADDMVASVLATSLEFDSGSDSCSIAMSHATDESIREVTPTRASLTEALAHELADEVARFAISYGQPSFMDEGVSSRESQTTIVSDSERRTTFPTPTQSISPSLASTTSVYALLRDSSRTLGAEAPGLVTEPPKQYSSRSFKSPSSQISTQRKSRRSAESIKSSSGRPMMTKLSRIVNRAKEVIVIDHFHIHHHHHLYDEGPQPGQSTQAFLSSVAEECSRRQAEAEALVHSPYFEKYAASGLIPRIDTTGSFLECPFIPYFSRRRNLSERREAGLRLQAVRYRHTQYQSCPQRSRSHTNRGQAKKPSARERSSSGFRHKTSNAAPGRMRLHNDTSLPGRLLGGKNTSQRPIRL